jgi:uncharacterized protein YbjQ (UPF0145 family)
VVRGIVDEVTAWLELWKRRVLSDSELKAQLRTLLTPGSSDEILKWADLWVSGALTDVELRGQVTDVIARGSPAVNQGGLGAGANDSSPSRQSEGSRHPPMLMVTTNDVPGYDVVDVHGDVFGLTVRARNYFSNRIAGLRTITGGEVGGYTKLLADSRNEARSRLMDAAREVGGNAIIGMRFDCNEIGDIMTEIAAYGTAVTLSPDPRGKGVAIVDRAQSE